jgi:transcriptional regulator with XRE-family HTH domain
MSPRNPEDQREFAAWLERKIRSTNRADGRPLRQGDLADAVGVGSSFISQILNGRRTAGADLVIRIANFFNEDANKLLNLAAYETISDRTDIDNEDPDVLRVLAAVKVLIRDRIRLQSAVAMLEGLAKDVQNSRKNARGSDSSVRERQA